MLLVKSDRKILSNEHQAADAGKKLVLGPRERQHPAGRTKVITEISILVYSKETRTIIGHGKKSAPPKANNHEKLMKFIISRIGHRSLALCQDGRLARNLAQPSQDLLITVNKTVQRVRNADIPTELLHQRPGPPQIMPRDARVQVMDGLELQSTVEKVEPLGTIDVHGGAEHPLRKGLLHAQICRAHAEVTQRDLNMEGRGDHVADEDEGDAAADARNGSVDDPVAEPGPESDVAGDFEPAVPPRRTLSRAETEDQVFPAETVEIEAAEGHDGVIEVVLVADGEFGKGVVCHDAIVIGAAEGGQEAVGDGEEGHVLDVGVMFGRVGDDVVDVVVSLPPSEA